ncbi:hypothetical protein L798_09059 [Zootermopsis nevadensis]|uniref:Uncharacterized protein n=1 Tax=Zootermopsis nevadensis TaxID=136037 RepID=A0A067R4G8_ZOONE|nr:hypothetical protein L798_09059 [Zootermopsis nevadensis]
MVQESSDALASTLKREPHAASFKYQCYGLFSTISMTRIIWRPVISRSVNDAL